MSNVSSSRTTNMFFTILVVLIGLISFPGAATWSTPTPQPVFSIGDQSGSRGDDNTSNTDSFKSIIAKIKKAGSGTLFVPEGTWLTGPFNLTSNMTLYITGNATIHGSTNLSEWHIIPPVKSYGQGTDHPGPRRVSLLHGFNLSQVMVGGENGIVDAAGSFWWTRHRQKHENYTRGHLFECMNCTDLLFQDVTLKNSPFWTVHPVFSRRVTARRLTILNDWYSPNTDGFDPYSTSDVLIEDSFFSTGDDGVAIKSGWDCYGVNVGVPSNNITIRNLTVISPTSAGVCIGSEMSGGVSNVVVEDSTFLNCSTGIRIKSGRERGGYVRNIEYRNINISSAQSAAIMVNSFYGGHPLGCPPVQKYPPPKIEKFNFTNIKATDIIGDYMQLSGLLNDPTTMLIASNVIFIGKSSYNCRGGVSGYYSNLLPLPPVRCGLRAV